MSERHLARDKETLTDRERAILLTPCDCGHDINDHGSLCWLCLDEGRECLVEFEAILVARIGVIVSERFVTSDDSPLLDWSDVIAAAEQAGLEANRALAEAEQRRREALRPAREPEPTDEEGDAA